MQIDYMIPKMWFMGGPPPYVVQKFMGGHPPLYGVRSLWGGPPPVPHYGGVPPFMGYSKMNILYGGGPPHLWGMEKYVFCERSEQEVFCKLGFTKSDFVFGT